MMSPDSIIFAGVELSSGRKPVTFAALDEDLEVTRMEHWTVLEAYACLNDFESLWLTISTPFVERPLDQDFRNAVVQAGFALYPTRSDPNQLLLTNGQGCFEELIGQKPLPRRSLEGRLQRAAILYNQGLQIKDPIDMFEEATRYKLVQGILPLENLPSPKELDALVAAYVAWLAVNRPGQILSKSGLVLPARE